MTKSFSDRFTYFAQRYNIILFNILLINNYNSTIYNMPTLVLEVKSLHQHIYSTHTDTHFNNGS